MDLFQITLVAETVAMEAAGEPAVGKLAVAYVIRNRAERSQQSYSDVVLRAYQFSCWNTDSPTRMNIDKISDRTWAECLMVTLQAIYQLVPDPTGGAVFYLNPAAIPSLPSWWSIDADPESEIAIGHHLFRKARLERA